MSDTFYGLTRGVPGVGPRSMAPPASTFEEPESIARASLLRYRPDKLFLGVIDGDVRFSEGKRYVQGGTEIGVEDDRHALTIAGSRAGKGRSAIIPNMLRYVGSVLAIDPKGELALATAEVRAKRIGQRVAVLDPFGTTGNALAEYKTGFNPVAMMRPESMIEDTILIADGLVVPGSGDPHWDESARTIIEGVILEVATAERFAGRRSLVTVRDLLAEGEDVEDPAIIKIIGPGAEDDETTALNVLGALHAREQRACSAPCGC